ncbi:MAG: purine-binding chemotaxis protein CheW [Candidatus Marinimicrobia bacterium]|jgi:purine-binding chemotaxis protein CheW|nr:purine-binding chemotaxis protein CheW [Candidatus Neomarinimicrobiota bacterium]MBT3634513.1 purine-binding chemotaxis protein CheW [Candidatus Neomarinimicrobiota bacterium]MBT3683410.1 purine-binding chemotaxis protein CheW [Candidatus Neomarinimicrobiota bacterium]MBT3760298.1 purine-binding chemotaxis protein CheW [Candidatus Neomarinimicrobiota bacterium]MBT3896393.1 purine-binding chemotaxis protein CheW [Candidatus Neomarinimicrobiota bacterium]
MVDILKLRKIAKAKLTEPTDSVKGSMEDKSLTEINLNVEKTDNKKSDKNKTTVKKKAKTEKLVKTPKKTKSNKPIKKKEKASIKELLAEKKQKVELAKTKTKSDNAENNLSNQPLTQNTNPASDELNVKTIEPVKLNSVINKKSSPHPDEKKSEVSDNKLKNAAGDKKGNESEIDDFNEMLTMISFRLANNAFGVNINYIQEVVRLEKITRVPHLADFMKGVINLRGNITPVIDLRTRLNLEESEIDDHSRIIIAMLTDQSIGFIVDSVSQILKVPLNKVEDPPRISAGIDSKYIMGVATIKKDIQDSSGMVVILDLDKTFDKKMIREASKNEKHHQ